MFEAILFFNLPLCPRPSKAHLAVIIGRGLIQHCVPFDTMGWANSPLPHSSLFFFYPFFFCFSSPPSLSCSFSLSRSALLCFNSCSFSPLCLTAAASVTSRAASAGVALRQCRQLAGRKREENKRRRREGKEKREGEGDEGGRAVNKYQHKSKIPISPSWLHVTLQK